MRDQSGAGNGSRLKSTGIAGMEPGDILIHTDSFGIVRRWRVCAVCLGGEGQESVIKIESVSLTPPIDGGMEAPMYIPEVLLRGLGNRSDRARKSSGRSAATERPAGRA